MLHGYEGLVISEFVIADDFASFRLNFDVIRVCSFRIVELSLLSKAVDGLKARGNRNTSSWRCKIGEEWGGAVYFEREGRNLRR